MDMISSLLGCFLLLELYLLVETSLPVRSRKHTTMQLRSGHVTGSPAPSRPGSGPHRKTRRKTRSMKDIILNRNTETPSVAIMHKRSRSMISSPVTGRLVSSPQENSWEGALSVSMMQLRLGPSIAPLIGGLVSRPGENSEAGPSGSDLAEMARSDHKFLRDMDKTEARVLIKANYPELTDLKYALLRGGEDWGISIVV